MAEEGFLNENYLALDDEESGWVHGMKGDEEDKHIEPPASPGLLEVLPHHALIRILGFLSLPELLRASPVCSHFLSAARESLRDVGSMDLTGCHGLQTVRALQWLSQSSSSLILTQLVVQGAGSSEALRILTESPAGQNKLRSLTHLKIDGVKALNDSLLGALVQCTPALTCLDISNNKVSDVGLIAVANNCPHMRRLIALDLFGVTNYGVDFVSRRCEDLEEVAIDGCVHITSDAVISLAANCRKLHTLSTAKCMKVTDRALAAFAPLGMFGDVGKSAQSRLMLRSLCLRQNPKIITISLLRSCVNLESLDLTGCAQVTADGLQDMLQGAGANLKHIALSGCRGISGQILGFLAASCPKLVTLKARGMEVRDEHLRSFANCHTGKLQVLNLTWCTKVTDEGLGHILQACPMLVQLEVEAVYNLTDQALDQLLRSSPSIKQLNIRMCHCMTADAIVHFARSTRVMSLHLSGLMEEESTAVLVRRLRAARPDCRLFS